MSDTGGRDGLTGVGCLLHELRQKLRRHPIWIDAGSLEKLSAALCQPAVAHQVGAGGKAAKNSANERGARFANQTAKSCGTRPYRVDRLAADQVTHCTATGRASDGADSSAKARSKARTGTYPSGDQRSLGQQINADLPEVLLGKTGRVQEGSAAANGHDHVAELVHVELRGRIGTLNRCDLALRAGRDIDRAHQALIRDQIGRGQSRWLARPLIGDQPAALL
ncbi:MAG: hypothetical protein MI920_23990, partial [Kiloniellales bacterium]|nr:hypothetical protein [Kiloniellales bacterium]